MNSNTNTAAARKAYNKGWKSGQEPSYAKVTNADKRGEHRAWYLGFFDAEGGAEKYASLNEAIAAGAI